MYCLWFIASKALWFIASKASWLYCLWHQRLYDWRYQMPYQSAWSLGWPSVWLHASDWPNCCGLYYLGRSSMNEPPPPPLPESAYRALPMGNSKCHAGPNISKSHPMGNNDQKRNEMPMKSGKNMGRVTEVRLSCYLVLLSTDSKTR